MLVLLGVSVNLLKGGNLGEESQWSEPLQSARAYIRVKLSILHLSVFSSFPNLHSQVHSIDGATNNYGAIHWRGRRFLLALISGGLGSNQQSLHREAGALAITPPI